MDEAELQRQLQSLEEANREVDGDDDAEDDGYGDNGTEGSVPAAAGDGDVAEPEEVTTVADD